MKKLLLTILLASTIWSCKKDDATDSAADGITQDARLIGGWRLDSIVWGSQTRYVTGQNMLTDSIRLEGYGYNGSSPLVDFHCFFVNSGTVTPLPEAYFWETYKSDSLGFSVGNHSASFGHTFGFTITGNRLTIHWSQSTMNQYMTPPVPLVGISYYHR